MSPFIPNIRAQNQNLIHRFSISGPKRILALDGGGIRGALSLGILERIERELSHRFQRPDFCLADYYDMIGGTSTGAIIATLLAMGNRVETVRNMYLALGKSIFSQKVNIFPEFIQLLFNKARFKATNLQNALNEHLSEETLGSGKLKTGLCIVIKKADTFSPWIIHNHPHGQYYESNNGILLKDLLRATSAAPSYFTPKSLHIGHNEVGVFIDGGVSSHNNPALIMFYLCTLPNLPYRWVTGQDHLQITSIGTGFSRPKRSEKELLDRKIVAWAKDLSDLFMTDATELNQLVLQSLGYTPIPHTINKEFGNLRGINSVREPLFTYLRYNVALEKNILQSIMKKSYTAEQVKYLIEMSHGDNAQLLFDIGSAFAQNHVYQSHFSSSFDMLHSDDRSSILNQKNAKEINQWIKANGKRFKKFKSVFARKAVITEKIVSITSSGIETENIATVGDYIVKNQTDAAEMYVVKSDVFSSRYTFCRQCDALWDEYLPIGEVDAIELTRLVLNSKNWPVHFYIDAAWEKSQYCTLGDYLVCTPNSLEFYRIGRQEFEQTYTLNI